MILFAQAVLYLWPLIVVTIFATASSTRRAMSASFVSGWLALPVYGIDLPGLPDYTKMSATVLGVMLGMTLFDQSRVASIRFRWFDLAPLSWCLGAPLAAILNNDGPYEAASSLLQQSFSWGFPYLIGRVYLTDAESIRELVEAILVGTLCYVPLCLFEIRFSPVLAPWIYGYTRWDGVRYGGFRPRVFLIHGLELGIWMTNASLLACVLWSTRAVASIGGLSIRITTLAILGTTILCKSTGALILLAFGLLIYFATKRIGKSWLIWATLAVAPFYCLARGTQAWSGRELVTYATSAFGADRAQSLEFRLDMEDLLIAHAHGRLWFGWGGFGRNLVTNKLGAPITVPDGYWIITFGIHGLVGLTSTLAMFLLPMALTLRRFPPSTWSDPRVSPIVAQALVLTITMIDFLSNTMLNPIYALAIAGIANQPSFATVGKRDIAVEQLQLGSEMASEGHLIEAEVVFREAIEEVELSGRDDSESRSVRAAALDGLGQSLLAMGRLEEATEPLRRALLERDILAVGSPEPERFRDLAIARESLGRALASAGKVGSAIEERRIALGLWQHLADAHPEQPEYRFSLAESLNDMAWLLATNVDLSARDSSEALTLAEEAIRISKEQSAFWNTLGVARYRSGDWAGAIEALERSASASPGGTGTSFDHYFLAMAWSRLHHADHGREWLERGIAWASRHRPGHEALERFRREAETLL